MIETPGAIGDIEKILALKTTDGIFSDSYHVQMSLRPNDPIGSPADTKDRNRGAHAANEAGKIWGMNLYSIDDMKVAGRSGLGFAALIDDAAALSATLQSVIAERAAGRRHFSEMWSRKCIGGQKSVGPLGCKGTGKVWPWPTGPTIMSSLAVEPQGACWPID